jgi:hypothetical protein
MARLRLFKLEFDIYDPPQLALILLPTTACILLYLAPIPGKAQMQFTPLNPNPLYMYTQVLIHVSQAHLTANLAAYLILAHTSIILFTLTKETRLLYRYSAATFIALPIVHALIWNLFTYAFFHNYVGSVGFSPMVSAYAGIQISYSTLAYVKATPMEHSQTNLFLAVFLVVAGIILEAYYKPEPLYITATACMAALFLYYVRGPLISIYRYSVRVRSPEVTVITEALLVGFVFVVLAFPENFVVGGRVTNILSHYVGLMFGLVLPQLDHHLVSRLPYARFLGASCRCARALVVTSTEE